MTTTNYWQEPTAQRQDMGEDIQKIFVQILLQGKLRQSVWRVTDRDKGVLTILTENNVNTGKPIVYLLWYKYPRPISLALDLFHPYASTPNLIDLGITYDIFEWMAKMMQGAVGLVGIVTAAWKDWKLHYRLYSWYLRESISTLGLWISNNFLPWATYWDIVSGLLIGL